ncbi:MAG: dTMP kinase [Candidatus Babeliales bacterium]
MNRVKQGILIAFEGIDGSGKSTLIKNILQMLQEKKYAAIATREPGGSWIGKHIRPLLQTQPLPLTPRAEYLLFAADRAQHIHDLIKPALAQGTIVLCDRMGDSSLAYQGYGRGLNPTMISTINTWAMNELKPTITVYVDIDLTTALSRIHGSRQEITAFEQEHAFLARVLDAYQTMYQNRTDVIWADGTLGEATLAKKVFEQLYEYINHA